MSVVHLPVQEVREPGNQGDPRHIAIIMDGNGRWARQRGLPRTAGHRAGAKAVASVVEACIKSDVEVLTLFAFSSENWRRPKAEIAMLTELFISTLKIEIARLQEHRIRFRVIGDLSRFSKRLQRLVAEAEHLTRHNDRLLLQIALNYGGRWDITQAARSLAADVEAGRISVEQIDEETLAARLSSPDLPDPDLFIRTGGEQRISNFLLWQCAYAEFYFTDRMWPEFDAAALKEAFADYGRRVRRFGRTTEQVRQQAGG